MYILPIHKTWVYPIIFFFIALALASCKKEAFTIPEEILTPEALTATLEDVYKNSTAPGFSVSIVKDNQILYQNAFGKANIQANKDMNTYSTQSIGSISKTFIAAAIVKAIEQGHFTMETNINDILTFDIINPKKPDGIIKVKHLVTHTSGLVDDNVNYLKSYHILEGEQTFTEGAQILINELGFEQRSRLNLKDYLLNYYVEGGEMYSEANFVDAMPGSHWEYSNIASSLAAFLIEEVSQISFHEYVDTYIFTPLEMHTTSYFKSDLSLDNQVTLYWNKGIPLPYYGNDSYPDGSIITSNDDLTKYLMEMLKLVKKQPSILFSQEAADLLFSTLLEDDLLPEGYGENQSVFWFLNGQNILHTGSDPGTTCEIIFDNQGQAGYFILTNMDASTQTHTNEYFDFSKNASLAITRFLSAN